MGPQRAHRRIGAIGIVLNRHEGGRSLAACRWQGGVQSGIGPDT